MRRILSMALPFLAPLPTPGSEPGAVSPTVPGSSRLTQSLGYAAELIRNPFVYERSRKYSGRNIPWAGF
jgi:hypothetical protein